ncbi:MAG: hypothetical protein EOO06_10660 [Chitinophagaceae bacterium]|nr:MAG: hypothetical protein EOO06_10660 [Chitinophagaceae bacterium]
MKQPTFAILPLIVLFFFNSCTKHEGYSPAGGRLPTNYITVLPNGKITPLSLTVASGSSITFVNTHNKPHRFLSMGIDSSIYTTVIPPDSSFFFKNDTLIGSFFYKCVLDSTITGTITIRP